MSKDRIIESAEEIADAILARLRPVLREDGQRALDATAAALRAGVAPRLLRRALLPEEGLSPIGRVMARIGRAAAKDDAAVALARAESAWEAAAEAALRVGGEVGVSILSGVAVSALRGL